VNKLFETFACNQKPGCCDKEWSRFEKWFCRKDFEIMKIKAVVDDTDFIGFYPGRSAKCFADLT